MSGLSKENIDRLHSLSDSGRPMQFQQKDEALRLIEGMSANSLRQLAYLINTALLFQRQVEFPQTYGNPDGSRVVSDDIEDGPMKPIRDDAEGKGRGAQFAGKVWIVNRKTDHRLRISPDELSSYEGQGYVRGRS